MLKKLKLHEQDFHPEGFEQLTDHLSGAAPSSSKNALLAAGSLGYGGWLSACCLLFKKKSWTLQNLPDYTYHCFLGCSQVLLISSMQVKPRLPLGELLFLREEIPRTRPISCDCLTKVQADYAGARATDSRLTPCSSIWSTWTRRDQKLLEKKKKKHKLLWKMKEAFLNRNLAFH